MYHVYHFHPNFIQIIYNKLVFFTPKDALNLILFKLWRHEWRCRYKCDISNKSSLHYASNEVYHLVIWFMIYSDIELQNHDFRFKKH